jgi:hypothetical protein
MVDVCPTQLQYGTQQACHVHSSKRRSHLRMPVHRPSESGATSCHLLQGWGCTVVISREPTYKGNPMPEAALPEAALPEAAPQLAGLAPWQHPNVPTWPSRRQRLALRTRRRPHVSIARLTLCQLATVTGASVRPARRGGTLTGSMCCRQQPAAAGRPSDRHAPRHGHN